MKLATAQSRCECQAVLSAELDENKQVRRGFATDTFRGKTRVAPAHTIDPSKDRFDVGWACPFCTRNTLRSFETGGLAWAEEAAAAPGS